MKLAFLLSFLTMGSVSAWAGNAQYNYKCPGDMYAQIRILNGKTSAFLSFPTEKGHGRINIVSDDQTGDLEGADKTSSRLNNSVNFVAFHYPRGENYIIAEGDTNEEGFIFAVEPGMLQGQKTVRVSTIYWNDRRSSDVDSFTCTRL